LVIVPLLLAIYEDVLCGLGQGLQECTSTAKFFIPKGGTMSLGAYNTKRVLATPSERERRIGD
jgi:hypothetical protein